MARKINIKLPPQIIHLLGGRILSILALVIACFIVLSGFWHQQQTLVATSEQQVVKLQRQLVDSTYANMTKVIKQLTHKVTSAAEEPEMVSVFESGHEMVITLQQTLLKKTIPEALAICLLTTAVDQPDPEGCIPINFVVLDLLRQAKTEAKLTPFAITELAEKKKALVITHQVANADGEAIGVLLIAFEPTEVLSLLPNLSRLDGFITLQQGKSTKTPLSINGDLKWKQGDPEINYHLKGSYWDLSYWPATTNSKVDFWSLVISTLLGLITLWLWREFWQGWMLRQDLEIVGKQIGDWQQDKLQLSYPVGTGSAKKLVRLIAGLGPISAVSAQTQSERIQDFQPQVIERPGQEAMEVEISEAAPEHALEPALNGTVELQETKQRIEPEMDEIELKNIEQVEKEVNTAVIDAGLDVLEVEVKATPDTIDFNLKPPKK